jgi:hypothetical protein
MGEGKDKMSKVTACGNPPGSERTFCQDSLQKRMRLEGQQFKPFF